MRASLTARIRGVTAPPVPEPGTTALKFMNLGVGGHVRLYRLSGGRLGSKIGRAPVMLLDHVGAKSGQERTTPLLYLADGEDLVIVASRGGSKANPAWLFNLRAHPDTSVQVGRENYRVRAEELDSAARAEVWPRLVEMYPDYEVYQGRADREIPVIRLRRV